MLKNHEDRNTKEFERDKGTRKERMWKTNKKRGRKEITLRKD